MSGYIVSIVMTFAAYQHVKQFTWNFRQVMTMIAIVTIIVSYAINLLMTMDIIQATYNEAVVGVIFIAFFVYFIARPNNKKQASL